MIILLQYWFFLMLFIAHNQTDSLYNVMVAKKLDTSTIPFSFMKHDKNFINFNIFPYQLPYLCFKKKLLVHIKWIEILANFIYIYD